MVLNLPGNARWMHKNAKVDGAIVMFSVNSLLSYKNASVWDDLLLEWFGKIPRVVFGSQIDVQSRRIGFKAVTMPRRRGLRYFETSAKTRAGLRDPFVRLAKEIMDTKKSVSVGTRELSF